MLQFEGIFFSDSSFMPKFNLTSMYMIHSQKKSMYMIKLQMLPP